MIALKRACMMRIEFYPHRSNVLVSEGIIHRVKNTPQV